MKQKLFFLSSLLLIFQYGCDEVINDTNLPYEEKLVIRGIMTDGDTVKSLYVGRTLPYEESRSSYWNPKDSTYVENDLNSDVKDAVVTVSVGDQTYTLKYFKNGYYKNDSLIGATGKTYSLHVTWKDKTADAVTRIPEPPILDSVNVSYKNIAIYEYGKQTEYICSGYARTTVNNILSLAVKFEGTEIYNDTTKHTYGFGFGSNVQKRTQTDNSIADILTKKFTLFNGRTTTIDQRLIFTLKNYDEPYYRYYLTSSGAIGESNFSIEPKPIAWNVSGDAIGMFIGASKSVTKTYKLK